MPSYKHSPQIKEKAKKLFLRGELSVSGISEKFQEDDGYDLPADTIRTWIREEDWNELRDRANERAVEVLVSREVQFKRADSEQQLVEYDLIKKKAISALEKLGFKDAEGASKAIDMAIKGERSIIGGVISRQLVQGVAGIILDEVEDAELRRRIGFRLQEFMTEFLKENE